MLQACSDDGEPHGTAGRPMLNVLTHAGLTNTLAVVSRFFGGTKLGTGGLVRAYAQAVNQALSTAQTDTYIDWSTLVITLDYANENQVRHLLSDYKFSIEQVSHEATVQIIGRADRNQVATMRADLGRLVLTFEGLE